MSKLASTRSRWPDRHQDAGSTLVAWTLMIMALGTFTPCVLVPPWRAHKALQMAQQVEQQRLDTIQKVVDRERRLLEALQTDPAVIARLAQRELGFKRPGERSVRVPVRAQTSTYRVHFADHSYLHTRSAQRTLRSELVLPPLTPASTTFNQPNYDYDALFCDDQTRLVLMAMSVALMGVALWLPSRGSS